MQGVREGRELGGWVIRRGEGSKMGIIREMGRGIKSGGEEVY